MLYSSEITAGIGRSRGGVMRSCIDWLSSSVAGEYRTVEETSDNRLAQI